MGRSPCLASWAVLVCLCGAACTASKVPVEYRGVASGADAGPLDVGEGVLRLPTVSGLRACDPHPELLGPNLPSPRSTELAVDFPFVDPPIGMLALGDGAAAYWSAPGIQVARFGPGGEIAASASLETTADPFVDLDGTLAYLTWEGALQRLDAALRPAGDAVPVAPAGQYLAVWSGRKLGVATETPEGWSFRAVDLEGGEPSVAATVESPQSLVGRPWLGWDGTSFVFAQLEPTGDEGSALHLAYFDEDGARTGRHRIDQDSRPRTGQVRYAAGQGGVVAAWIVLDALRIIRFSPATERLPELELCVLAPGWGQTPFVRWDGQAFVALWDMYRDGEPNSAHAVALARFDFDGTLRSRLRKVDITALGVDAFVEVSATPEGVFALVHRAAGTLGVLSGW